MLTCLYGMQIILQLYRICSKYPASASMQTSNSAHHWSTNAPTTR